MTIENCILAGNDAGGATTEAGQVAISPVQGQLTMNFSCVQGLTGAFGGVGNIGHDPRYTDADGLDDAVGTADDDLRLSAGSACIDAGRNAGVPAGVVTDLDGRPRFVDDPATPDTGVGTPPVVDMGAYEFHGAACAANCDGTFDPATGAPTLDILDFACFQNAFALGDLTKADCDGSGVLDINDFTCFQNSFALGCP